MSKSRIHHHGRVPFQPQAVSTQNIEAAREDGTTDHKKSLHEAKIPTGPETTDEVETPMASTTTEKDK